MADASPITLDTVIVATPGLMASEVDGELVMMHIEKGTYYGLDPVGARIWQLIAEPTSVGDVCTLLVERYEVDEDTCRTEVIAFATDMVAEGLVTTRPHS
jgi:hypothetical protein